ncbi:hypothetical protein POG22_06055 [Geitlerinema sp. CS-897]|nr:hypothetical protein [Geitlerinema sp. CS-897]
MLPDYIDVREISRDVYEENEDKSKQELKSITLSTLREVLESGLMEIGDLNYTSNGHESWGLNIDESIEILRMQWEESSQISRSPELDKAVYLGLDAWLVLTDKGEEEAKRILKERAKLKSDS